MLKQRKLIVIIFTVLALVGGIAQFGVAVNYNMTDYLPENAPSTIAIEVMDEEFSGSVANTRVMIEDVNVQEALQFKQEIEDIDGVSGVMWLDDVIDIKTPLELVDKNILETYYQNNHALFTFEVEEGKEVLHHINFKQDNMSNQIQFIGISPTELKAEIVKDLKNSLIPELSKQFQPKQPAIYLTRNEVAKMLQINLSTVHNWSKKGILKANSIQGRIYFKREEVESAIVELK